MSYSLVVRIFVRINLFYFVVLNTSYANYENACFGVLCNVKLCKLLCIVQKVLFM